MPKYESSLNTKLKNIMYAQSSLAVLELIDEALPCIKCDIENIKNDDIVRKPALELINKIEMAVEDFKDLILARYRSEWELITEKMEMVDND